MCDYRFERSHLTCDRKTHDHSNDGVTPGKREWERFFEEETDFWCSRVPSLLFFLSWFLSCQCSLLECISVPPFIYTYHHRIKSWRVARLPNEVFHCNFTTFIWRVFDFEPKFSFVVGSLIALNPKPTCNVFLSAREEARRTKLLCLIWILLLTAIVGVFLLFGTE